MVGDYLSCPTQDVLSEVLSGPDQGKALEFTGGVVLFQFGRASRGVSDYSFPCVALVVLTQDRAQASGAPVSQSVAQRAS